AGRTVQLGQLRAGLELGFMQSVRGRLLIVPIVIDFSSQSLGDVLKKRTSQVDVEALDPVADRQNGLVFGEGVLQEREIGALAVEVGRGAFRLPGGAKMRGIDVCGAAGKNESVERFGELTELGGR